MNARRPKTFKARTIKTTIWLDHVDGTVSNEDDVLKILEKYATWYCCGFENGADGKKHLQIVAFNDKRSWGDLQKIANVQAVVGDDITGLISYCMHTGNNESKTQYKPSVEFGNPPKYGAAAKRLSEIPLKDLELMSYQDILDRSSSQYQYLQAIKAYNTIKMYSAKTPIIWSFGPLYSWQQDIINIITSDAKKYIYFITDIVGQQGKTEFAFWRGSLPGECYVGYMPKNDPLFTIKQTHNVYHINFTRHQTLEDKFIPYTLIETLHDQKWESSKYMGHKISGANPHVFVYMNSYPNYNQISVDRCLYFELINRLLVPINIREKFIVLPNYKDNKG